MAARTRRSSTAGSPLTEIRTAIRLGGGRRAQAVDAGDAVLGVRDALVVHAREQLAERVPDAADVAQRQIALVELPVRDALLDDLVDHRPDRLRRLLGQR